MKPIDIIVPYVNNLDPSWVSEFRKYKGCDGLKGTERFRDNGTFKYFFRSIEKNCPWCRYVFLVVSSESQIPYWLNESHPKLRIVYHKDYIPAEFLPTFNSNVIELFYSRIEELSDNFVLCNDDMFFLKDLEFFENDKPRLSRKVLFRGLWTTFSGDTCFVNTVNNNSKLISKITGMNPFTYCHFHVPMPHNKLVHQYIWYRFENELLSSIKDSRFRLSKNYTQWLFEDCAKLGNSTSVDTDMYERTHVFTMSDTSFDLSKYDLICYNDGGNYDKTSVNNFLLSLDKMFVKKSSFEV